MTKRMKAKGFTLTELIICMGIMLLVVYLSMNSHIGDVTAKQEAEKLAVWLERIFQKAARTRVGCAIKVYINKDIGAQWDHIKKDRTRRSTMFDDEFPKTQGFTFSYNRDRVKYRVPEDNVLPGTNGHFDVIAPDGSIYYVVISKTGRVRLSETEPGDD